MTAATVSTTHGYDVVAPAYDLLTEGYAYGPWLCAIAAMPTEPSQPTAS